MDTKKKRITEKEIKSDDIGIKVSDLIKLLDPKETLTAELLSKLNISEIKDEFIPIKGSQALFNSQLSIKKIIEKQDLVSTLENVTFFNQDEFTINFHNIDDSGKFPNVKNILAYPIYSAQRDFFNSLFGMDKYAKNLIENNHKDIVVKNLELLKSVKKIEKKYRLLYHKTDEKYYLRAIVSKDNYFDYNNSVAVVIGLLTLFEEMKNSGGMVYSLKLCEYNESNIRMIFDTSETKEIEGIGFVRNIIEVSNDEIKREALKFYGICSIIYNERSKSGEIFIKPTDVQSKIFSIKHNQKASTAIPILAEIKNAKNIHDELYNDILDIKKIKNTEQIKFLVKRKIENSKNEDIKKFQNKIFNELTLTSTKNILDLLKLFDKVQILAEEDIEASEYLRFVFYEALMKRK